MQVEKESDEESEEVAAVDLEKLADSLTTEEKDYLPYQPENEDEETEE